MKLSSENGELKNRNDNDDYDISNIRDVVAAVVVVESLLEFQSSDDRRFWSSFYYMDWV